MTPFIADIHCDLLEYLEGNAGATPFDAEVRCSIPQLKNGGVVFQGLAIYCSTDDRSVKRGMGQAAIFQRLEVQYPNDFRRIRKFSDIAAGKSQKKIGIVAAIENASGFSLEDERLQNSLQRLDQMIAAAGPILYISLTHFGENRFAGGNATQGVGLKPDGKTLLKHLSGKKIAIDLSHTSDAAAYGILDFVEKQNLDIPVIASHSNFRKIEPHDRNLPDDLAKEIIRRKGLIGLNFMRDFIGTRGKKCFLEQIEYGLKLGAQHALCLGTDFFHTASAIQQLHMPPDHLFFYEGFDSSACYPQWLDYIRHNMRLDETSIANITGKNALKYLRRFFANRPE